MTTSCISSHTVTDAGRVWFTAPGLFECSLSLAGTCPHEGWFFGHARFLFGLGGDGTGIQDFPTNPTGVVRQFISDEADARLSKYLPLSPEAPPLPADAPPKPTLPPDVADAPLVRLFNFLRGWP
jgi:mediator of RNA polymerase II transcription subunit 14